MQQIFFLPLLAPFFVFKPWCKEIVHFIFSKYHIKVVEHGIMHYGLSELSKKHDVEGAHLHQRQD